MMEGRALLINIGMLKEKVRDRGKKRKMLETLLPKQGNRIMALIHDPRITVGHCSDR